MKEMSFKSASVADAAEAALDTAGVAAALLNYYYFVN